MSLALLSALSTKVRTSDPYDKAAHARALDGVCEVSAFVRSAGSAEAAACMLAASHALQALVGEGENLPRADVHRIAGELLRIVYLTVASTCERRAAGGAPQPADAPLPPAVAQAGSAPAAAPFAAPVAAQASAPGATTPAEQGAAPVPPAAAAGAPAPAAGATPVDRQGRQALLGRMLLSLGHVTRDNLARALRHHRAKRLPVGECLLLMGACRPELVLEAIKLQSSARSASQPAAGAAAPPPAPVPARPPRQAAALHVTKDIFFGEVLLGFGMISNEQLEQAMHLHHHLGVRVGAALVKMGALTEEDVQKGLELQRRLQSVATVKARR